MYKNPLHQVNMTFETTTLIVLATIMLVREISHYLQVNKLQELLKANNISDYYSAKSGKKVSNENKIAQVDNDIIKNEQDFDIRKASKVIINGEEMPIHIE